MLVFFTKPFPYWHGGYERKVYGPGQAEVDDEVAKAALACGAIDGAGVESAPAPEIPEEQQAQPAPSEGFQEEYPSEEQQAQRRKGK